MMIQKMTAPQGRVLKNKGKSRKSLAFKALSLEDGQIYMIMKLKLETSIKL